MSNKKHELYEKVVFDALDIGIYPAAVTENGKTVERTEFQNGWNAAAMEIAEKVEEAVSNIKNINEELEYLLVSDICFQKDNKLYVMLNDIFHYACADREEVLLDELEKLVYLVKIYNDGGAFYWAYKKRGYLPDIPKYRDLILSIKKEIDEVL